MKKTLVYFLLTVFPIFLQAQTTWTELAGIPEFGIARAVSFTHDTHIYVSGPSAFNSVSSAFWLYDVDADSWEQLDDFPGVPRRNAFAFSIGDFGYVGMGFDGITQIGDFWKYDVLNDTWTQLDDFPDGGGSFPLGLSTDSKGYMVGGDNTSGIPQSRLWEFDPLNETWTMLEDIPGPGRWMAFGWIIEDVLYIGGGLDDDWNAIHDFYSYDLNSGEWNELPACPSLLTGAGAYFTLDGLGYYVEGRSFGTLGKETFVFSPIDNIWKKDTDFPGEPRAHSFSAVVGNAGIVGLGDEEFETPTSVYKFTLEQQTTSIDNSLNSNISLYPNPNKGDELSIKGLDFTSEKVSFSISNVFGERVLSTSMAYDNDSVFKINVKDLVSGLYFIQITGQNENEVLSKSFVKY